MRVVLDSGETLDLGETEATPTIGIVDYSRRVTDDYGVTTVVERGFARRMSVRLVVPFDQTDALQASLAAIRAKPARWIADEGVDWLDFRGFFKDFEIDLPVPPKAYCTLTVEALAATEAFADPGGDPAPLGQASTLQLLQPATIAGGALIASGVPENDYPEWSADTTYPLGARVIKAATHRIYESGAIGNKDNDPAGTSGKWQDIGPTNRWAMFDQALGSTTNAPEQILVTIAAGTINAAALLDVKAATVRVQAAGYDRTIAPNASGTVTFLDMPETVGQVSVLIAGPGTVEVGTLLVGKLVGLGSTTDDAKAGITDFSRKEADEFGDIQVVERAWAKRMTLPAKLRRDAIDLVAGRIAAVRAKPSLWIGKEGMETLTVYGFFKDFSVAVDTTICTLSLSIEGLSTAGKVEPLSASVDWPDVGDPAGTKPEDNATVGAPAGTDVAGKPAEEVVGQLEEQELALDQLDLDVAQATINIAAAQATIVQMQTEAVATKAELEADIASLNATADQIQTDAAGTRAALATAQAEIIAAGGRIDTVESTLGDQGASITSLSQTVSNHTGRLASIDTTLSANGASINQNAQAISAVQGDLASLSSTVATQGASITQNAQAITTANQNIASVSSTVSAHTSSISQNAQAISTVQGDVASLSSTVSAHTASISQNAQAISTAQGNLATLSSTVSAQGSSITQLQTASSTQAGQLATLNLKVSSGYTNLLPNGDFSNGLTDWAQSNGAGFIVETQWSGRRCVAVTSGTPWLQSPRFAVAPTITITVGVLAADDRNANKMYLQIRYEDASGGNIQYGPAVSFETNLTRKYVTHVVPSGAAFCRLWFSCSGNGSGYVEINNATAVVGPVDIANAQPTATITQNYTALKTATTQLSSLETTVSTQGSSITANATAITTLQTQTASLNFQVASGNPNLLVNSTFQNGFSGWTMNSDYSWSVGNTGAWGSYAGTGSNPAQVTAYMYQDVASPENDWYTATADMGMFLSGAGAAGINWVEIQWLDSTRTQVLGVDRSAYRPAGQNFDATGAARQALKCTSRNTYSAPWVRIVYYWQRSGGNVSSYHIRQTQFVRGSVLTPYSQEATVLQAFSTLSTLTTQYASLSTTVSTQGATITSQQTAITTINNNLTTVMGRAAVTVDVNGRITGWETNNNGTVGDFTIRSDRFRVIPPGGAGSDGFYIDIDSSSRTTQYILSGGIRVVESGWLN